MYVDYPTLEDVGSKSGPGETNLQQTLSTSSNKVQLAPSSGKTLLLPCNIQDIDRYCR